MTLCYSCMNKPRLFHFFSFFRSTCLMADEIHYQCQEWGKVVFCMHACMPYIEEVHEYNGVLYIYYIGKRSQLGAASEISMEWRNIKPVLRIESDVSLGISSHTTVTVNIPQACTKEASTLPITGSQIVPSEGKLIIESCQYSLTSATLIFRPPF